MSSERPYISRCALALIAPLLAALVWTQAQAQPTTAVDLSLNEEDVRISGASTGDLTGIALASGDINGDGIDDVLIGASESSPGGRTAAGSVYLVLGNSSLSGTLALSSSANYEMVIQGGDSFDRFGTSVATGDINKDGYDDIIVGASTASPGSNANAGKTYLFYGAHADSLPATIDLNASTADAVVRIWGQAASDAIGAAVASGDINGDGFDDMIVGASNGDGLGRDGAGRTHVLFGSASLGPNLLIDLSTGTDTTDVTIIGRLTNDQAGAALASGDIDGDGFDDVIIGAASSSPNGGSSGSVFVVYGESTLDGTIDLLTDVDLTLRGGATSDQFGWDVESGDFNKDGYDDILVGAPGTSTFSGNTHVMYGDSRPMLPILVDLLTDTMDLTIIGPSVSFSGRALAAANFNGDGFIEVVTTAPLVSPSGRTQAGVAYGFLGDQSLTGTINLGSVSADVEIYGDDIGDVLGFLAMSAGDINGDGVEDIIIGAPAADSQTGEVVIVYGEPPYLEVSVATASSTYNQPLAVAVSIDSTSGMLIVESAMAVSFNSDLLTVTSVTTGTLTTSWTVGHTICAGPGSVDTVKVDASTSSSPITTKGEFLQVNFFVNKLRDAITAPVTIESLTFNGGESNWNQTTPGPITLLGNDGTLAATVLSEPGDTLRVRVTDVDLNIDPATVETYAVTLQNSVTGESETLSLTEQSIDDAVFFGSLATVFGAAGSSGDGTLSTQTGEDVYVMYNDPLSATGPANAISDTNLVVVFGDADGGGSLQAFDSALILAHAADHLTLTGLDSLVSNLDLDAPEGQITAFDAALAIQRRLGIISRFPVQEPGSKNHPQPETTNNAKPLVEERYLALVAGQDYISVRADQRDEILAADLVISGIEGRIEMAPDMERFEMVYVNAEDGLHVAFAGPRALEGAGELFRIYPNSGNAQVRGLSGHFNGGRLVAYWDQNPPQAALPLRLALHPNHPNPFNAETLIRFDLPAAQTVSLDIFNALGQKVRTLVQGRIAAGAHQLRWDSRDDRGQAVATGAYFYRLAAGTNVQTQRMMLVK